MEKNEWRDGTKCPQGCGSDTWHIDVDCPSPELSRHEEAWNKSVNNEDSEWKEEFRENWDKLWEIAHYNITTRESMIDFISSLLQSERERMVEELDEMAFEQDDGSEVTLFIDWDKARKALSLNNK